MTSRTNYTPIASHYNRRYAQNPLAGVARELQALVQQNQARDVLEVGCGTGRWVSELHAVTRQMVGLDYSFSMLQQAREQAPVFQLTNGDANHLPFTEAAFDMVLSINALHHYTDQRAFVLEARRVLRPGGALVIVNLDPHVGRDRWYLYEYFEGVRAADLRRFPSSGALTDWMLAAGFNRLEWRVAEHIQQAFVGRAVFNNHFTQKHGSSQLANLSDEAYATGLNRIQAAIAEAEAYGNSIKFVSDQRLYLLVGWLDKQ